MTWKRLENSGQRWEWTADSQLHLLLIVPDGTELRELHVTDVAVFVHIYQPNDLYEGRTESYNHLPAVVYPLLEATHVRTWADGRVGQRIDADAASWPAWFTWLAEEGYVQ